MFPVYKAITVEQIGIKGGSTKPCLMAVCDDENQIQNFYVVKVFRQNHIQQTQPTNKEVYCNVLAKEFELSVPKAALIRVDKDIIGELSRSGAFNNVIIFPGFYFGTEYIKDAKDYTASNASELEDWEMETIFAFDTLIRNVDRRERKPNFFLVEDNPFLIDHELSLSITQSFFDYIGMPNEPNISNWSFMKGSHQNHVFLSRLQKLHKVSRLNFETFFYYLADFDIDILDSYAIQLENSGNDTIDFLRIKPYLVEIKSNPRLFLELLQKLLDKEVGNY